MKVDSKIQNSTETKDDSVQLLPEDTGILQNTVMPFSKLISSAEENGMYSQNISERANFNGIDFKYDAINMSEEDAKFFVNLATGAEYFVNIPQSGSPKLFTAEFVQNTPSAKSVEATNKIMQLLETAQNTQKPVRISFDNNVSVVLKIDRHGKLTAEFIPGSIEAENYLRNNVDALRQKFDEQNLPYNDILYKENSKKKGGRQKQNKGE